MTHPPANQGRQVGTRRPELVPEVDEVGRREARRPQGPDREDALPQPERPAPPTRSGPGGRGRSKLRIALRFLEKILLGGVLGTYLIVSRAIAVVGALYLVLYFFVGTSAFMDVVREAISDQIPGVISAATVRWGPAPWELRVADGRIFGENGEQVIQVDAVIADVDLLPTLAGLFRLVTEPDAPLAVHFDRVRLGHPKAFIRVDAAGRVDIERAFTRDEDPPGEGPPQTFAITAKAVDVMAASGTVDAPGYHLDVTGLDAATNFTLTGEDHVAFFVPWARVARADNELGARVRLDDRLDQVRVPVTDLRVEGFLWDGLTFAWQSADADVPSGRISGTGGWDVRPDSPRWHGTARVHLERGAPALAAVAGDVFSGELDATLSGSGDLEQANARAIIRAPDGELGGLPFSDLRIGVRSVPQGGPSDPLPHAFAVDWLAVDSLGGHIAMHNGFFSQDTTRNEPDGESTFAGAIRLDGVLLDAAGAAAARLLPADLGEAGELRSLPLTELAAARLSALDATVHGSLVLSGRLGRRGEVEVGVLLDDVAVAWRGDGLPLPGDYLVGGTARWRSGPRGDHADGLELLPERRLELQRVAIDGHGDRVRLEGSVDLATGELDLTPYLRLGDVRDDARALGLGDLDGRFVLKGAHVGGTLAAPYVRAVASWSGARVGGRPTRDHRRPRRVGARRGDPRWPRDPLRRGARPPPRRPAVPRRPPRRGRDRARPAAPRHRDPGAGGRQARPRQRRARSPRRHPRGTGDGHRLERRAGRRVGPRVQRPLRRQRPARRDR